MIIDANQVEVGYFQQHSYDVCIAGAGFAGIVLARRLADYGLKVALLEAGGMEFSEASQEFYRGQVVGRDYFDLDVTRLRFLGGSSNHWGGWCRPLDPIDFERRTYVPWSGWPIGYADLHPYTAEAASILDLDPSFDMSDEATELGNLKPIRFQFSGDGQRLRIGRKYCEELKNNHAIDTYLNLAVTNIVLEESGDGVDRFLCRQLEARTEVPISITATWFVVAMGGLENPRLLLNCTDQIAVGLGNDRGLVGRFFMEHLHFTLGDFVLENRSAPVFGEFLSFEERLRSYLCRTDFSAALVREFRGSFSCTSRPDFWAPTTSFMRKRKILNCGLRIIVERNARGDGFDGILHSAFEQAPNPDSRVMLVADRDPHGLRRVALDWRLSEQDKATARECALEVGRQLLDLDKGRLKLRPWLLEDNLLFPGLDEDEVGGNHHMGTTRMGEDPSTGVVDRHCRLFGTNNLFMAGSSVFPTSGHANPTFTIVQLSLRLADHIGRLATSSADLGRRPQTP